MERDPIPNFDLHHDEAHAISNAIGTRLEWLEVNHARVRDDAGLRDTILRERAALLLCNTRLQKYIEQYADHPISSDGSG